MKTDFREWLRTRPMVVLLLPLVAGILVCYYTRFPVDLLKDTAIDYLDTLQTYQMVISDYPSPRAKTTRYTAQVVGVADSDIWFASAQVYLYFRPDSTRPLPEYGDTLLVRTRIQRPAPTPDFDYGTYLRRQHIAGTAFVGHHQWLVVGKADHVPLTPRRMQHALKQRYQRLGLEGQALHIISALTLGYREDLDRTTIETFQRAGAAHILAVSGLHTGIIYSILLIICTLGGRLRPLYTQRVWRCCQSVVIVASLWLYAVITGMTPSVVRSVLMLSLLEVGRMLYRQSVSLNTIAAAAFLILAFRPLDLFSVSFMLSFSAVVALVLFVPGLTHCVPVGKIHLRPIRRVIRYVVDIVAVSIAAQLGTLPIALYFFGQCSNYFLLTNLLVIPLAWLIVVCALLLLLFGGIPYLHTALLWACRHLSDLLAHSVGWVEALPGSTSLIHISLPMVGLLYIAILSGYFSLKNSLLWLIPTALSLGVFCYLYTIV